MRTSIFWDLNLKYFQECFWPFLSIVACAANSLIHWVYTVCVLVHDILFQILLSRKEIYSRFWLVKTTVWPNTRQKQANHRDRGAGGEGGLGARAPQYF